MHLKETFKKVKDINDFIYTLNAVVYITWNDEPYFEKKRLSTYSQLKTFLRNEYNNAEEIIKNNYDERLQIELLIEK